MGLLDTKEALFDFLRGCHPDHLQEFRALELLLFNVTDEEYQKKLDDTEVLLKLEY